MPAEPRIPGDPRTLVDYVRGLTQRDSGPTFTGSGPLAGYTGPINAQTIADELAARGFYAQHPELVRVPVNPQVGVVQLPPVNTPEPAPLPNPTGDYVGPFPENDLPNPITGYTPDQQHDPIYDMGGLPPWIPGLGKKPPIIRGEEIRALSSQGRVGDRWAWNQSLFRKKRKRLTDLALGKQVARRVLGKLGPLGRVFGRGIGGGVVGAILTGVYEAIFGDAFGLNKLGSGELPPEMRKKAPSPKPAPPRPPPPTAAASPLPSSRPVREPAPKKQTTPIASIDPIVVTAQRLPQPSRSSPSPTTTKRTGVTGSGAASRGLRLPWQQILLSELVRGRTKTPRDTLIQTTLREVVQPGETLSQPSPLTPVETGLLPSLASYPFPTQYVGPTAPQNQCSCRARKRQNRRTCRAKAAVKWAGGPNKGKAAGRRCISWES